MPPGVVNYLPGRRRGGRADRLVEHPDVSLIAFTGSREVGLRIQRHGGRAAPGQRQVKRVIAEMGGKNAIIVDDDADLDEAVQGVVASAFGYAGQKCSACSRVIVVGAVYDALHRAAGRCRARSLPIGPPDDPGDLRRAGDRRDAPASASRGTSSSASGRRGRSSSARSRRSWPARRLLRRARRSSPTSPPTSPLAREEIFGPVLTRHVGARRSTRRSRSRSTATTRSPAGVYSRSPAQHRPRRDGPSASATSTSTAPSPGALVGRQPFGGSQALRHRLPRPAGPDYLLQFLEPRTVTENTLRRGFASDELA